MYSCHIGMGYVCDGRHCVYKTKTQNFPYILDSTVWGVGGGRQSPNIQSGRSLQHYRKYVRRVSKKVTYIYACTSNLNRYIIKHEEEENAF